ncbi:exocyst complex component Sec5-domain-containing protein [Paraphysoderma sedebokerense]|nr:exocyst complex component Sec5-domain-containing protein [Paraphysoderma sedebokerense]
MASSSAPPDPNPPSTRRANRLLKNYYGLADSPPAVSSDANPNGDNIPASASPTKKKPDPLDIDSVSFEVDKHLKILLNEKQLPGLLKKDNYLIMEIKQLDGDMKTLVYENYSKFISATDTIRKMKSNVENMESEFELLSRKISTITEQASNVNSFLSERRQKIHQLSGVSNVLQKLQFIFELPKRLNQCIQQNSYAQAVKYYSSTSKLLAHYRNSSIFNNIERDCNVIMEKLQLKVKTKLKSSLCSIPEVSESVALLIGLNRDPIQELLSTYLKLQSELLIKNKAACLDALRKWESQSIPPPPPLPMSPASSNSLSSLPFPSPNPTSTAKKRKESVLPAYVREKRPPTLVEKLEFVNRTFLRDFINVVESFEIHFMGITSPRTDGTHHAFTARLTEEQSASAMIAFHQLIDTVSSQYTEILTQFLSTPPDILSIKVTPFLEMLDVLHEEIKQYPVLDKYGVSELLKHLTKSWIENVIKKCFTTVESSVISGLKLTFQLKKETTKPNLKSFLQDLQVQTSDSLIQKCLPVLESVAKSQAKFLQNNIATYMDLFKQELSSFWTSLVNSMTAVASFKGEFANQYTPTLILAMSRLLVDIQVNTLDRIYGAFSEALQFETSKSPKSPVGSVTSVEINGKTINEDARNTIDFLKSSAEKLLARFVEVVGWDLSSSIRLEYDCGINGSKWLSKEAVTATSAVWVNVLSQIKDIDQDVAVLYEDVQEEVKDKPETGHRGRRGHAHRYSGSTGSMASYGGHSRFASTANASISTHPSRAARMSTMEVPNRIFTNIDKLFSEKVEFFGKVEFSRKGILLAIMRIVVKSWIEVTRNSTFGKLGFQQVQLDVEWLKFQLKYLYGEKSQINTMLDEVTTSCYRRCIEPVFMDRPTVERLAGIAQNVTETTENEQPNP